MEKQAFQIARLVSIATCLLSLFLFTACAGQGGNNEFPKQAAPRFSDKITSITEDTLQFESYERMYQYFKKIQDSISSQFKNARTDRVLKQRMDSMQSVMDQERIKASYRLLRVKGPTINTYGAFTNLLFQRGALKIGVADSIYALFPEELKNTNMGKLQLGKLEERRRQEKITSYSTAILQSELKDKDAKTVMLEEIAMPYILLDFWTSWCVPCRKLIREMADIQPQIEDAGKVKVVLLSLDAHGDNWRKAMNIDKSPFLNLWEPKELASPIARELHVTKFPHNVLMDKKGKIYGTNLHGDELLATIAKLP